MTGDHLLRGKVVLVTGAGSGIGEATARALHDEGCLVYALDRSVDRDQRHSSDYVSVEADLTDDRRMEEVVREIVDRHGRIDGLVNVAGIYDQNVPCEAMTMDLWDAVFAVNVRGTAHLTNAVLPHMLDAGDGSIVIVSSTAALRAGGGGPAYAASKGALISFARQVAHEVASRGVRVNVVAPGAVATGLYDNTTSLLGETVNPDDPRALAARQRMKSDPIPIGRVAAPAEVAAVCVFLTSSGASYLSGAVIPVDGGVTG